MGTPFTARAIFKMKKIARGFIPAEREFRRVWPLIEPIEGWLFGGQEKWLFKQARALPDGANIVEIGSFKGRSTCCLAFGCRGTKKRVFAVDSFDGNSWDFHERGFFEAFRRNVERCGLSEYVEPVAGVSSDVAKTWNKPIHLLFIDGSHRYEDVLADYAGFFPHVVPNGIIAFHDVQDCWPGVLQAWHGTVKRQLSGVGYCSTLGYGRKPRAKALNFHLLARPFWSKVGRSLR